MEFPPVKLSCVKFRLGFLGAANRGDDCRDIEVDSVKKLAHDVLVCYIRSVLPKIRLLMHLYTFVYIHD